MRKHRRVKLYAKIWTDFSGKIINSVMHNFVESPAGK